jgi:hypothetical protein
MRAEAALFGGTGTAKIHMIAGIQKSITKVRSFASKLQIWLYSSITRYTVSLEAGQS